MSKVMSKPMDLKTRKTVFNNLAEAWALLGQCFGHYYLRVPEREHVMIRQRLKWKSCSTAFVTPD